jgi:hypothetical protein
MPVNMDILIEAINASDEPDDVKARAVDLAKQVYMQEEQTPVIDEPDMPDVKKPDKPVIEGRPCELCKQETLMETDYGQYPCLTCGYVN